RNWVAQGGYGLAVMYNRWKFALARYHSTREFDLQDQSPIYGPFTISRSL
ncbi:MAG: lipid A-modifier LpxR family protein, partial [Stenotrophomonas sp.]